MSEMVERVALAMTRARPGFGSAVVPVDAAREYAHIAIEAMREPTEAMVDAGREGIIDPESDGEDVEALIRIDVIEQWQAMIDMALKD